MKYPHITRLAFQEKDSNTSTKDPKMKKGTRAPRRLYKDSTCTKNSLEFEPRVFRDCTKNSKPYHKTCTKEPT